MPRNARWRAADHGGADGAGGLGAGNGIQKVLEGANIKLGDVTSSVVNKSGRAMLQAMIQGETDPAVIAELARGRLRSKRAALQGAVQGLIGPHQMMLLDLQLEHLQALEAMIDRLTQATAERMHADEPALQVVDTIPGIGRRIAEDVLAEIGTDTTRFPSDAHLASWAGVCPGHDESAGKRQSGRARHGNRYVRTALVEAAQAAARTKDTYLGALYHRLAARRGKKRAALARRARDPGQHVPYAQDGDDNLGSLRNAVLPA